MLEALDAVAVRRWCARGLAALAARREEIDAMNVYPVPDGDTGTNLVLTFQSVLEALDAAPDADGPGLPDTMKALAHGALMGARGNSGVILSQFLRGLADVLGPLPLARGRELAEAFGRAARAAWAAVADPVEGTVLTVARAAAEAARAAGSDELAAVVRAAGAGATEALRRTPEQLPVLARAGVVDAGGYGLSVLLDALVTVVSGDPPAAGPRPDLVVPRERSALDVAREAGSDSYAYEVQYLLAA
ncbi:MAG TPA: DAK2 domain-containing protein, partial [Frankiaceae bacterium]|nr:DAK2 domain-containing protein [Frankiaceae bacterium]